MSDAVREAGPPEAANTSTATMPNQSAVTVYDIVTEPPAAAVDPAALLAPVKVFWFFNQRGVWFGEVIEAPLHTASTTMFPLVVPVTATVGVPVPAAVTAVPKPLAPVNEIDPAVMSPLVVATATVNVPVGGLTKPNSCMYPADPLFELILPSDVIDTLLYVAVVVPDPDSPIATPTTSTRLEPVQVCDQEPDVDCPTPKPAEDGPTASNATAISLHRLPRPAGVRRL